MTVQPGSIEHLTEIISHVVAPAFTLSAVASFVSILVGRNQGVQQRLRELKSSGGPAPAVKAEMARLKLRGALLHRALLLSMGSGAAAALLILMAFAAALVHVTHVWFAAGLFIVSMFLLLWSLLDFSREIKLGLGGDDDK